MYDTRNDECIELLHIARCFGDCALERALESCKHRHNQRLQYMGRVRREADNKNFVVADTLQTAVLNVASIPVVNEHHVLPGLVSLFHILNVVLRPLVDDHAIHSRHLALLEIEIHQMFLQCFRFSPHLTVVGMCTRIHDNRHCLLPVSTDD